MPHCPTFLRLLPPSYTFSTFSTPPSSGASLPEMPLSCFSRRLTPSHAISRLLTPSHAFSRLLTGASWPEMLSSYCSSTSGRPFSLFCWPCRCDRTRNLVAISPHLPPPPAVLLIARLPWPSMALMARVSPRHLAPLLAPSLTAVWRAPLPLPPFGAPTALPPPCHRTVQSRLSIKQRTSGRACRRSGARPRSCSTANRATRASAPRSSAAAFKPSRPPSCSPSSAS